MKKALVEVMLAIVLFGIWPAVADTIPRKTGNGEVPYQQLTADDCTAITAYESGRALGQADKGLMCVEPNGDVFVWNGNQWVKSSASSSSTSKLAGDPARIDADDDGKDDARLMDSEVLGFDGEALCWDIAPMPDGEPDGSADICFHHALGVIRGNGDPWLLGNVSIVAVTADEHGEIHDLDRNGDGTLSWDDVGDQDSDGTVEHDSNGDGTLDNKDRCDECWMILKAYQYHVPITVSVIENPDNSPHIGWTDANYRMAYEHGVKIVPHTASHCCVGAADPDLSEVYDVGGEDCMTDDGTVTTDGATKTVTGSGTGFADYCTQVSKTPVWGHIAIDTDGDGTVEYGDPDGDGTQDDWEGYITAVNSDTELTVDTVPPACSGCKYKVVSSGRQFRYEVRKSCEDIENAVGDPNYECNCLGAPGDWGPVDDIHSQLAAHRMWATGSQWDDEIKTEAESPGIVTDVWGTRMHVACDDTWDGLRSLLDTAIEAHVSLFLSGHTPLVQSRCTGEGDVWSRANYEHFLQYIKEKMAEGKVIVAPLDIAVRLVRFQGLVQQYGVNLIANDDFQHHHSGLDDSAGSPGHWWPFEISPEADCSYDATEEALHCVGDNGGDIVTYQRLTPGWWEVRAWVKTKGYPWDKIYKWGTHGVNLCIRNAPRKDNVANKAFANAVWSVEPGQAHGNIGECSPRVPGTLERDIYGKFFVAPENDGVVVAVKLNWSADSGSEFWVRDVTLVKVRPQPTRARLGYFGAPVSEMWMFPQDYADLTAAAKITTWVPMVSSAREDAPHSDLWRVRMVGASGQKDIMRIGTAYYHDSATWRGDFSPSLALGYSDGSTASESCFIVGRNLTRSSGKHFSVAMCGESAGYGRFLVNTEGTAPGFDFHAWLKTGTSQETILTASYGGSHTKTWGVFASGLMGTNDGLRIGTYNSNGDSFCVRRVPEDSLWLDGNCNDTKDNAEGCIAAGGPDPDCDGTAERSVERLAIRLNIEDSWSDNTMYWDSRYGPNTLKFTKAATLRQLRCWTNQTLNTGEVTCLVKHYSDSDWNDPKNTDLSVTFGGASSSTVRGDVVMDDECTSNCDVAAGRWVRVAITTDANIDPDATVDVTCLLVYDEDR